MGAGREYFSDPLGNLIVHIGAGSGRRILLDAHMDTIGFCITQIQPEGRLKFCGVGFVTPQVLPGKMVVFEDGSHGTIRAEAGKEANDIAALYIQKASGTAQIGDMCCYKPEFAVDDTYITSCYLDNRAGCAALLAAIRELKDSPNDIYCSFSVQEEVGMRGTALVAEVVEPDEAYVVDMGIAGDTSDAVVNHHVRLGGGVIEKIMDDSIICHPEALRCVEAAAQKVGVPLMRVVCGAGFTNAGRLHTACRGIPTAILATPTRNIHSPQETICVTDVKACAKLLVEIGRRGKGAIQ